MNECLKLTPPSDYQNVPQLLHSGVEAPHLGNTQTNISGQPHMHPRNSPSHNTTGKRGHTLDNRFDWFSARWHSWKCRPYHDNSKKFSLVCHRIKLNFMCHMRCGNFYCSKFLFARHVCCAAATYTAHQAIPARASALQQQPHCLPHVSQAKKSRCTELFCGSPAGRWRIQRALSKKCYLWLTWKGMGQLGGTASFIIIYF